MNDGIKGSQIITCNDVVKNRQHESLSNLVSIFSLYTTRTYTSFTHRHMLGKFHVFFNGTMGLSFFFPNSQGATYYRHNSKYTPHFFKLWTMLYKTLMVSNFSWEFAFFVMRVFYKTFILSLDVMQDNLGFYSIKLFVHIPFVIGNGNLI
jgi:hypothetical protein